MKCKSCHREMTIVRLPKYPGAYGVVVLVIGMGVSFFLALKRPEMWYLSVLFGVLCLVLGAILARAKGELVLCTSCGGRDALDEAAAQELEQETREKQAAELRARVEEELRPALEAAAKVTVERELEGAIAAEVRARLERDLKAELEDRIRQDLGAQLRADVEAELRPALEAQLTPVIEARLKTTLEAQLRPVIEHAVRADLERTGPQKRDAAKPAVPEPPAIARPEPKLAPVRLAPARHEPAKPEPPPVEPPRPVAKLEPVRPEPARPEPVKPVPVPVPVPVEPPKPAPSKPEPVPVAAAPQRVPIVAVTEPHKKAARKARVIVSDVLLYDRALVEQAVRANDPYAALDRVWAEAQRTFNESVAAEIRKDTDYLRDAFEDMFKKIRKELKLD